MNMLHSAFKNIIIATIITFAFAACSKDTNYYHDSGVTPTHYDETSLEYLQKDPNHLFDSLVKVINLAGLSDVINDSVTFFAPPDSCIKAAVGYLNSALIYQGKDSVTDLSQISPDTWKTFLSMYIFQGVKKVVDYPQLDLSHIQSYPGATYTSYGGRIMNIGAVFDSQGGVQYAGYRHLVLSYIPSYSTPLLYWFNANVATSDVETNTGVIQVLKFTTHIFGFDQDYFITTAESDGITY